MARVRVPPLDVEIDGTRLRVYVDHADAAERLGDALRGHMVDDRAELGFILEAPDDGNGLYRLLDRSGIALARSRSVDQVLASLAACLASLARPPEGMVRLRLRSVVDESGRVAVLGPPIGANPPLIERRLAKAGWRIIDQVALAMTPRLEVPAPPARLRFGADCGPHHVADWLDPFAVGAVLVPVGIGLDGSEAFLAASLASLMLGAASDVFAAAIALAEGTELRSVNVGRRGDLYEALEDL